MHVVAGLFPSSWTGNTPFKLPFAANLIVYLVITVVCLTILAMVLRYNRRQGKAKSWWRWTTQDIIVIAILGVLLEVYDNLIGDQFITPLIQGIPLARAFAVNDLPYMFLLMTGVAIVRKPGSATALVFLDFLLMQLLYGGSESSPLYWPYGLLQGVFIDLYLLSRAGRAFSRPGWSAVGDGLVMGALRAVPAVALQTAIIQPLLSGATQTGADVAARARHGFHRTAGGRGQGCRRASTGRRRVAAGPPGRVPVPVGRHHAVHVER
jgi:hypothetical protein